MSGQVLVVQADAGRLPLPDATVDLVVTSPPSDADGAGYVHEPERPA